MPRTSRKRSHNSWNACMTLNESGSKRLVKGVQSDPLGSVFTATRRYIRRFDLARYIYVYTCVYVYTYVHMCI